LREAVKAAPRFQATGRSRNPIDVARQNGARVVHAIWSRTSIWFGLMAPAGTPRDTIDKLARAVREAVTSNEVVMTWRPQGIDPLSGGPEEFARHIETESKRWGGVAHAAGLKK
jgi:tripartite-type tricarboxylate transporter receptor subunit TctC